MAHLSELSADESAKSRPILFSQCEIIPTNPLPHFKARSKFIAFPSSISPWAWHNVPELLLRGVWCSGEWAEKPRNDASLASADVCKNKLGLTRQIAPLLEADISTAEKRKGRVIIRRMHIFHSLLVRICAAAARGPRR
jgi:hypothetical protein